MLNGLNIYNLYSECYHPEHQLVEDANGNATIINVTDLWLWKSIQKNRVMNTLANNKHVKLTPPCVNATALTTYMNNMQVRQA